MLELSSPTLEGRLPVARALDVGCGTGHSTQALLPYAQAIVGVDSSWEILAQAPRHDRIAYRKGRAEALPCLSQDFALVTVSSAYHWFDHERFRAEASRVLRAGGWLVLYQAGSTGRPTLPGGFDRWRREVLRARSEGHTQRRAAHRGTRSLLQFHGAALRNVFLRPASTRSTTISKTC